MNLEIETVKKDWVKIVCLSNVEVPRHGRQDVIIPFLRGKDLNKICVLSPDDIKQDIFPTPQPERFTIGFRGLTPNIKTDLDVYYMGEKPTTPPAPVVKAAPVVKPQGPPPKKSGITAKVKEFIDPALALLQKKHARNVAEKRARIAAIRAADPSWSDLQNKRVLTFDHAGCWARALGMIQKAVQLQTQLRRPLHDHYHRITGQGDGAIIAAAVAAGISPERLGQWWTNEWRKAHTPGRFKGLQRLVISKIKPNETGFDAKKARKALQKFFLSPAGVPLRMKHVLTELHITLIQADLNISRHESDQHPDLELGEACEDSAVTKMDYNQKATIKGEAVFLGAVEKSDVLGMAVSPDNEGLEITSIGTPVRINPDGAGKLPKLDAEADKKALRAAGHFVYEKRVGQVIDKLNAAGHKIRYLRLECSAVDGVVSNSTTNRAMNAGRESGEGRIDLPGWFAGGLEQIA